jgi:hypothetical protein
MSVFLTNSGVFKPAFFLSVCFSIKNQNWPGFCFISSTGLSPPKFEGVPMKNHNIISVAIRGVAAMALSLGAASSFGATWTENYKAADCGTTNADAALASGATCTSNATISGYYTTNSGSTAASATVWSWRDSGLGVVSGSENSGATGPHAVDNSGSIEGIVFTYTTKMNLTSFKLGWNGTDNSEGPYDDSDVTLFAWTGSGAPTTFGYAGWAKIADYSNVGSYSDNTQSVSSAIYSSYWMVSAYTGSSFDTTSDSFKLLAISGQTCDKTLVGNECKTVTTPPGNQVPEPGSLALLGLGAMGMIAARRRQQGQSRQVNLAV